MKYLGAPQSGSQAGTTASHNRAGQYYRNRRTPVVPTRTARQLTVRGQFTNASSTWKNLSPSLQAQWTSFAGSHPYVDALGQTFHLTGQQMYIAIGMNLLNAGQSLSSTVPTDTTVNPVTPVSLYCDAAGTVIVSYAPVNAGDFALIAQSKQVSSGVTFNKTFTQCTVDSSTFGVVDISSLFAAQWGTPILGNQIFVRVQPVNASGMSTAGVIVRSLVVAAPTLAAPTAAASTAGTTVYTFVPTPATAALLESAPSSTGPWSVSSYEVTPASPLSLPTGGATTWYRLRIQSGTSWSPASTPQVGS